MRGALLCVSFGTSVASAAESIDAVEQALRAAAPERSFARAYTSGVIRRILAERGQAVPGVEQALETLWKQGAEDVFIQPTHLVPGVEYEKLCREAEPWRSRFAALTVGRPLLSCTADLQHLQEAVSRACPPRDGETQVLFGHGTEHFSNVVYPALQTAFQLAGRRDVLVGTVEGWPAFSDVEAQLPPGGAVHLLPLMLVAGDHALNDMAGADPDSWKSRLESRGCTVRCTLKGLGMLEDVREMYRAHLREDLARRE